jgi:hypothetical protein
MAAAATGAVSGGAAREAGADPITQMVASLVGGFAGGRFAATKKAAMTADQVRKQASNMYKQAESLGGNFKPEFSDKFIEKIQSFKPQSKIAQEFAGDSEFTSALKRLEGIKGKAMTLSDANALDKEFTKQLSKPAYTTPLGKLTEDGKQLFEIQSEFRNLISNVDDSLISGGKEGINALKEARGLWSKSRKLSDIEAIIERASMTDNPATSIKSGFRALATNKRRLKGYSPDEVKAIKKAASTGVLADTLRIFGSRLIPVIAAGSSGGIGMTAASAAASNISRGGASRLQTMRAQNVANVITGNQPRASIQGSGLAGALLQNRGE